MGLENFDEGEGSGGRIGYSDASKGVEMAHAFEVVVPPHDELFGGGVVDDLGAFNFAAGGEGMGVVVLYYGEGYAFVFPVVEVGRAVAGDADLGIESVGAGGATFAVPIVGAAVVEHAAAVGVDGGSVGIEPDLTRAELVVG